MAKSTSILLVGNSLALLVAARELARGGHSVALLTDGKPPGGHFAGVRVQGHAFDIGMVLLEKPVPIGIESQPGEYRPDIRNDWTRFAAPVREWLEDQCSFRRVRTPTVQLDGVSGPDYLIANRLDLMLGSSVALPEPLPRSNPRHAIHKNSGSAYDTLTYGEAAVFNHGEELHELYFEPFVRKLYGVPSSRLLARYHRSGWVPLYYPETLVAAIRGEPPTLSEYAFHTTEEGFVGAIVSKLVATLLGAPNVEVVTAPIHSLSLVDETWRVSSAGSTWSSNRAGLGLPADRCRSLLGLVASEPPEAASVALLFCLVRARAVGRALCCHMVADRRGATYRLTDQDALAGLDPEWHRVVVEASPDELTRLAPSGGNDDARDVLVNELKSLMQLESDDSIQVLKYLVARNALALPTMAVVANAKADHLELSDQTKGAALSGALLGYGAASFNDQIVQGLHIARSLT